MIYGLDSLEMSEPRPPLRAVKGLFGSSLGERLPAAPGLSIYPMLCLCGDVHFRSDITSPDGLLLKLRLMLALLPLIMAL